MFFFHYVLAVVNLVSQYNILGKSKGRNLSETVSDMETTQMKEQRKTYVYQSRTFNKKRLKRGKSINIIASKESPT